MEMRQHSGNTAGLETAGEHPGTRDPIWRELKTRGIQRGRNNFLSVCPKNITAVHKAQAIAQSDLMQLLYLRRCIC